MLHVTPINDLKEHIEEGTDCWCIPKVIFQGSGDALVIHNSADRREVQEQFDDLISE